MQLEHIKSYWNLRAEGFSLSNIEQLRSDAKQPWLEALRRFAPRPGPLRCLDVGCGPGFLAILLAKDGHEVHAVDYSENMIEQAVRNAEAERADIAFERMDAQRLAFEEASFDFVVTRNLSWNLELPEQAYAEWLRVLKPGGRLLNFDGNHFLHHYDTAYRAYRESGAYVDPHKKEQLQGVDLSIIDRISKDLPLSRVERPAWDAAYFERAGATIVASETERQTFTDSSGEERTIVPRFMICAEKPERSGGEA